MSVHVVPVEDDAEHARDDCGACWCEPRVEWINQENGLPYSEGPLVVHDRRATGATRWAVEET